jgi:hypothetical protein
MSLLKACRCCFEVKDPIDLLSLFGTYYQRNILNIIQDIANVEVRQAKSKQTFSEKIKFSDLC